jgi:hypothetical protein
MIPFSSILERILFDVYLIISGEEAFGLDEYFWLLAEL